MIIFQTNKNIHINENTGIQTNKFNRSSEMSSQTDRHIIPSTILYA